jgi:hypothetical protein
MAQNTIDNQIAKTTAYLASPEGKDAWAYCESLGYDYHACMLAASMEATGCRKVESLQAIERGVIAAWVRGNVRSAA